MLLSIGKKPTSPKKRTIDRIFLSPTGGYPPTPFTTNTSFVDYAWIELMSERMEANRGHPEEIRSNRILDAPGLEDDYYLTLLDWSPDHGQLAVGLGASLYLYDVAKEAAIGLSALSEDERLTCVRWRHGPISHNHLFYGTSIGRVCHVDVEYGKLLRHAFAHTKRTTVMTWDSVESILSTGGRDKAINHYDDRVKQWMVSQWTDAHDHEVCGLQWEPRGGRLASGGNDNQICIWDGLRCGGRALHTIGAHTAAVKALAWSPAQRGLLASGGGTADRSIRLWSITNTAAPTALRHVSTNAQVCHLLWSRDGKQLASAHGFCEHLCHRWDASSLRMTGIMRGHEQRVLYMALSPDGKTIVTGGADETLRFWPTFHNTASTQTKRRQDWRIGTNSKIDDIDFTEFLR